MEEFNNAMTRKELCEIYDLNEETVRTKFGRIQQTMLKKYDLILTKTGRGDKTEYFLEPTEESKQQRAETMMTEKRREIIIAQKGFSNLLDFNFMVFLAICTTPMGTFYGSYEDFLGYVEVRKTKDNIRNLKEALTMLSASKYINYTIDETNDNYFNAFLFKRTREDMAISLDMAERCQRLAKENNKQSWVPLLKTWIGVQYMYDKQPFTVAELCAITGLSAYQIRESKKVLEKDELFVTSRAYIAYDKCIGTNVELNGIYEANRRAVQNLGNNA